MPPWPMSSRMSSWGKWRASSEGAGGTKFARTVATVVSTRVSSPCLRRHWGQRPWGASAVSAAPQPLQTLMVSIVCLSFVGHRLQKDLLVEVTRKVTAQVQSSKVQSSKQAPVFKAPKTGDRRGRSSVGALSMELFWDFESFELEHLTPPALRTTAVSPPPPPQRSKPYWRSPHATLRGSGRAAGARPLSLRPRLFQVGRLIRRKGPLACPPSARL